LHISSENVGVAHFFKKCNLPIEVALFLWIAQLLWNIGWSCTFLVKSITHIEYLFVVAYFL
jgi:hypothetical protein